MQPFPQQNEPCWGGFVIQPLERVGPDLQSGPLSAILGFEIPSAFSLGSQIPDGHLTGRIANPPERKADPPEPAACLFDDLSATDLDEQIALLPDVPEPTLHEKVRMDYEILGLTPLCHPMVFYREKLAKARVRASSELAGLPNNTIVILAGVVVVCMRPPTKSGAIVVFITLEDEDGLADCVVFPKVYEQYGKVIFNNPGLIIEGKLQKMGQGISIIVRKVKPLANTYRTDDSVEIKPFTERRRIAGARSFVRSAGV